MKVTDSKSRGSLPAVTDDQKALRAEIDGLKRDLSNGRFFGQKASQVFAQVRRLETRLSELEQKKTEPAVRDSHYDPRLDGTLQLPNAMDDFDLY